MVHLVSQSLVVRVFGFSMSMLLKLFVLCDALLSVNSNKVLCFVINIQLNVIFIMLWPFISLIHKDKINQAGCSI
jgi:hypothetical protein